MVILLCSLMWIYRIIYMDIIKLIILSHFKLFQDYFILFQTISRSFQSFSNHFKVIPTNFKTNQNLPTPTNQPPQSWWITEWSFPSGGWRSSKASSSPPPEPSSTTTSTRKPRDLSSGPRRYSPSRLILACLSRWEGRHFGRLNCFLWCFRNCLYYGYLCCFLYYY